MSDVKNINGYDIKDAVARNYITTSQADFHNRKTNAEELRERFGDYFHRVFFPVEMDSFFDKIQIFESYNKENYTCLLDEASLMNTGGNTYYLDINSTESTEDGSQTYPWKDIKKVFQNTSNGDTVIVKRGIYTMSEMPATSTNKNNINLICESGTIFTEGTRLTWTQNETYSNVYQATRTRVGIVIDLRLKDSGYFPRLTKVNSVADVAANVNTFYWDSDETIVYVNLGEEVTNDKIIVNLNSNYCPLNFTPQSQNSKWYIENATFLGGTGIPLIRCNATSSYDAEFNCVNCNFYFGGSGGNYGAIPIGGAKTVFINCKACFNTFGDGFAYHIEASKNPRAIEINCEGAYNGLESYGTTMIYANNGSTIHEGCQIIRVNGNYHNNNGCNVGDTGGNAISLNYGCMAWDSEVGVSGHNRNADFGALNSSAKMYLFSCFAQGKSEMNLYAGDSSNKIYTSNCLYNTTGGNGTIEELI